MCGTSITMMTQAINLFIIKVIDYLEERELAVSPEKSTVTLFTPDTHEVNIHPQVKIKDKLVKLDKTPKLLGLTFDTMHYFSTHIKQTAAKAKKKVNILKALAGTTWGQDQETLVITYKSIGRSVLEYAAPIWSPIISETSWNKLKVVQNSALRAATGCFLAADPEHLHQETHVLPIKAHANMVTQQYLAACHLPDHPGGKHLDRPPGRNLKKTMLNHNPVVDPLFYMPETSNLIYKEAIKSIHTKAVGDTINSYKPNKVLGTAPPKINKVEKTMSRRIRSQLSQLRSGYSNILNSFRSKLDAETTNNCPECHATPHDTIHLFECPANPTHLTPSSLWTEPDLVVEFLKLDNG